MCPCNPGARPKRDTQRALTSDEGRKERHPCSWPRTAQPEHLYPPSRRSCPASSLPTLRHRARRARLLRTTMKEGWL